MPRTPSGWRKSSIVAPPAASPARSASGTRRGQRVALRARERAGAAQRMDPRAEQRLVGVDVAHARDPPLVEQERLDRRAAPARQRAAASAPSSAVAERLDARRATAKNASSAGSAERQLAGAEAPRVAEAQLVAVDEPDPHALVRRVRIRVVEEACRSSAGA